MPGSMSAYQYTSDDGRVFAVQLADYVAAAGGFTRAVATDTPIPSRFRLRHINVTWFSAGGGGQAVGKFTRKVPVPTVDHALWQPTADTVNLPDFSSNPGVAQQTPNVMRPFTITGWTGESKTRPKIGAG